MTHARGHQFNLCVLLLLLLLLLLTNSTRPVRSLLLLCDTACDPVTREDEGDNGIKSPGHQLVTRDRSFLFLL